MGQDSLQECKFLRKPRIQYYVNIDDTVYLKSKMAKIYSQNFAGHMIPRMSKYEYTLPDYLTLKYRVHNPISQQKS